MEFNNKSKRVVTALLLTVTTTITAGAVSMSTIKSDDGLERVDIALVDDVNSDSNNSNPGKRNVPAKLKAQPTRGSTLSINKLESVNKQREFDGKVLGAIEKAEEIRIAERKAEEERQKKIIEEKKRKDEEQMRILAERKAAEERARLATQQRANIAKNYPTQPVSTGNSVAYTVSTGRDTSFKSYMAYTAITSKRSMQYKLQHNGLAYTDDEGFRRYQGHYMIALGTGFGAPVGTYVTVQLSSGNSFTAVVGDIKADRHTDSNNIQHSVDNSVVEFIIDNGPFKSNIKSRGFKNVLGENSQFAGQVTQVIVHK